MPMIQKEWAAKPLPGAVGRRANMEEWNTITRTAGAAGIGFAHPVQRGTSDDQVVPLTTGNFLGISEADQTLIDGPVGTQAVYPVGSELPVCEKGVIWARAVGTCTAGNPVYWDSAADGYANDSSKTLIPGAEFDNSAAANGLVKIRLRRNPATPAPAGGA